MSIILALDLSTKSSGQAIYEDQKLSSYGCITAASSNLFKRIEKMTDEVENLINKFNVTKVVIEEVILDDVHNNNHVFKALMYLQGFIVNKLDKYNLVPDFLISSEQRKKCGIRTGAGIHRDSLKSKDIAFVKSQFDLTVNDDIADAICIGFAYIGGKVKNPSVIITDDGFEFG